MAYTAEQLEELRRLKSEGVLKVRFVDGQEMTLRSLDEINRIEAQMVAEINPTAAPIRRTVFSFER